MPSRPFRVIFSHFERIFCRQLLLTIPLLAGGFISESAVAGYTFTPLGDLPGGDFYSSPTAVSADGSVVVGRSDSAGSDAFRWTKENGMVHLQPTSTTAWNQVLGISPDGLNVVGSRESALYAQEAVLWTPGGSMIELGKLRGGAQGNFSKSVALGVTAMGPALAVVGYSFSDSTYSEACLWLLGGIVGLGDLPGGNHASEARAISRNGQVIVGRGDSASGYEAFRWSAEGGMVGLGDLPGNSFWSQANGVSDDGSVIVGDGFSDIGQAAFRWTLEEGMVALGDLPGGSAHSHANGVSGDGSVVIGRSGSASGQNAFLWRQDTGMLSIGELLRDRGVANVDGWTLADATGISADGQTIVGWGINPQGNTEAWVATVEVPETSTLLMSSLGLLGFIGYARRRQR